MVLGALALLFFGEFLVDGRVYYPGDIARLYLPARVELAEALRLHTLPWWTDHLGAGYPLLAEGEVGALYPPNWISAVAFPPAIGTSISIVAHYVLVAIGFYLLLREMGRSLAAALFGGIAGSMGGFYIAHLSHLSILHTAAWLPLLLFVTRRTIKAETTRSSLWWAGGVCVVTAMQFLGGHAQVSLLVLLATGLYGLWILGPRLRSQAGRRAALSWLGALVLGAMIALPQLLPAAELAILSQRAGGLEAEFFTSYSFHPLLLLTFISPFPFGNPYPTGSVEFMGYVGVLPLALALYALVRSRDRDTVFFAAIALVGLVLSFGKWNPLYSLLARVPLLNLFRVPARYLLWTTLGTVVLASRGLDCMLCRSPRRRGRALWTTLAVAGITAVVAGVGIWGGEHLLDAWQYMPALLIGGAVALCLGASTSGRQGYATLAILILVADLYAHDQVLDDTFNVALDPAWVGQEPSSLAFLREDPGPWRLYTKEEILPALEVQRESYYPNLGLAYGLDSANLYVPLVQRSYQDYMARLTPAGLNRLGVKYYLIPQLLPVSEADELYDVYNPFSALPVNVWIDLPRLNIASVEIESFLSHSVDLTDGTLVAEVLLRDGQGNVTALPLRAGMETAEWTYDRSDVAASVAHSKPAIAFSYPARSGYSAEEHQGHVYVAHLELPRPISPGSICLRLHRPEAFTRIERVALVDADGQSLLLSHVLGLGDHRLAYRSENVLIYHNEDVWPRAYSVPTERAHLNGAALHLDEGLRGVDLWPVDITERKAGAVAIEANLPGSGYIILADQAYPGWHAWLDGVEEEILVVDGLFRGVRVSAGQHRLVFQYAPLDRPPNLNALE